MRRESSLMGNELCLVKTLVRYLARHGVKVGPMLHFESGVSQIWRKASLLTSDFNGHNLQIGAVTMALQRGLRT